MRSILLIVALCIIIRLQYAEASKIYEDRAKTEAFAQDKHGITDIRNNIKNSVKNTWDSIKNFVKNTKDKVKQWVENVKNRARKAKENLQDRIKEVRERSKNLLEKLIGTGQLVKECFQEESKAIEEILKQIVQSVTSCISDTLVKLEHLDKSGIQLELNETIFVSDVESQMNNCVTEKDVEECLHKVRCHVYSDMENMEKKVLTSKTEARGITDDLLDTVLGCSIEGLLKASNVIATESIQIITCVKEKDVTYY